MPVVMKRCRNDEDDRDRQQRHHRHREQVVPLRLQLALEGVERELQRELPSWSARPAATGSRSSAT